MSRMPSQAQGSDGYSSNGRIKEIGIVRRLDQKSYYHKVPLKKGKGKSECDNDNDNNYQHKIPLPISSPFIKPKRFVLDNPSVLLNFNHYLLEYNELRESITTSDSNPNDAHCGGPSIFACYNDQIKYECMTQQEKIAFHHRYQQQKAAFYRYQQQKVALQRYQQQKAAFYRYQQQKVAFERYQQQKIAAQQYVYCQVPANKADHISNKMKTSALAQSAIYKKSEPKIKSKHSKK